MKKSKSHKILFFLILSFLMHITLFIVVSSFASLNRKVETLEVFMLSQHIEERSSNSLKDIPKSTKNIRSKTLEVNEERVKVNESTQENQKIPLLAEGNKVASDDSQGKHLFSGSQTAKAGQGFESSSEKTPIDTEFGSVTGPKFIYYEKPNYPPMARRLGKEGKVLLRLTIDEKGELIKIEVLESAPYGFTESAVEALKKSKFAPAKKDGKPVPSRALLPVKFVLTN